MRRIAGFVGKLRGSLASAAGLRPVIILLFILYELPYLRRLSTGEHALRLPLWDLAIADDPRTFVVLEAVYVGSSVLACFRRIVVPACLVAAAASFLLVTLDLSYRLQFAFLPAGALLAFALSELLSRTGDPNRRVDWPFVFLLGSVYGFASFHKLLNFHWMKTLLPSSVFGAPGGPLPALFASADNPFLLAVAWIVVPYEALLAVLTLTRKWLRLRLVCVSLFHWTLIALVPFIWHVSLYMLCLHLYLAALQRPSVRQRMLVGRNWILFAAVEGLLYCAEKLAPSIPAPAGNIVGAAAFASFVLFPVFYLYWPYLRAEREPAAAPHARLPGLARVGVSAYGLLVLTFGFSPFLLEKHYSVLSIGWAMFAGGEYREGSYFVLKTPATPCYSYPVVNSMIWAQLGQGQFMYLSFRRAELERLKRLLDERNCGGPPLQVETGNF